jgi:hypothetical protein
MMRRLLLLLAVPTLSWAFSTTQIHLPSLPGDGPLFPKVNKLVCARWTSPFDLPGATRITGQMNSSQGVDATVVLYPDNDASAKLVSGTTFVAFGAATTAITGTGVPFNVVAGTMYRLCVCADGVGAFDGVKDVNASPMDLATFLNAGAAGVIIGQAANACTGGAIPPATTGVISAGTDINGNPLQGPVGVIE